MSWIRKLVNVFRPDALSRDIAREMEFHVAERTDELIAAGATPAAAEREARRRLGHATTQRERTRDADVSALVDSLVADVRYAMRALRRTPGFTAVAVVSLALGIGANTAIFSVVNAVMLRQLPVENPRELVQIKLDGNDYFTNPLWEQVRDHQASLGQAVAFAEHRFSLSTNGESRPLDGTWVSGDYFGTLGVGAVLGRPIARADDWRGCPPVAMLSYGYWQSAFGGRSDVLDKPIELDGHPFQIIGVAEPGFGGVQVGFASRVFIPLCAEPISRGVGSALDARSTWWLAIMARPLPGLSNAQMQTRLATLAPQLLAATLPKGRDAGAQRQYLTRHFDVVPATRGLSPLSKQYGRALYVMLGAVGLVLLIACANVANLLLARGAAREHELAIRAALGAGRSRILRQLLVESAVLALSGAVVGVILARVTSGVLATLLSSLGATLGLPLDARVLGFTLGVAAFTGLLFGLAPAWRSALAAPHALLTRGARTTAGSHARYTPAKLLVSFQVALLLPLLAGAGLLVGTLRHLSAMDPGFNPRQIVLMTVDAQHAGSLAKTQRPQAYQDILTRLRAIPGVTSASASDVTPIGNRFWNEVVAVAGYSPRTIDDSIMDFNEVSSGYFATLQSPVVLGRDFTAADGAGAPRVAIVNEAAVRKFFGGRNPLGQLMRTVGGATPAPPIHIVGVVKDAKYQTLREDAPPTAYVSLRQDDQYDSQFNFELRAPSGLEAVRASALAAVKDVNPGITASFTTLSEQVSSSLALERLLVRLSTTFGALALVLAMIGLYGVMSYSVIRRRAEIGIRMALGAGQRRVAAMILREVAVVLVAGLITGLGFASASTRLIASFLYGLDPMDLGTLMGSMALLAVVALAAAYVPARRAASVDPMDALREE